MRDAIELASSGDEALVEDGSSSAGGDRPNVDLLVQEFKQAGVMPNGWYDIAFNEEQRRMIWAGQSPDGRKWDENMPEGEEARPWDGCSDTRIPLVDGICNGETAILKTAFKRAEVRASAVDPAKAELVGALTAYLHWLVNTKFKRAFRLESELSAQYSREHGFCVAYVGWEREIGRRRVELTLEQLAGIPMGNVGGDEAPPGEGQAAPALNAPAAGQAMPGPELAAGADSASEAEVGMGLESTPGAGQEMQPSSLAILISDPTRETEAVAALQSAYESYVGQVLGAAGFFEDELKGAKVLKPATARKAVRELRETGRMKLPVAYVCKNQPLVYIAKPYQEVLAARGTMMLQQARAIFWRRWMSEAELESKAAEGWDPDWIDAVKKTKGNISSWAGALGATSLTGPSTKTVGSTTYLKVTEENNPLMEVVYAHVKKVDEDGVTGVYETILSPHVTKNPRSSGQDLGDFCAKHELVDYAHGRYPFIEFKRENLGRALTDTRSVAEIAGTWQNEVKKQRDMLFNRADWDTLPPVSVPKLGGMDYRLGPGAQVAMGRAQEIKGINLEAPAPTLALELVKLIGLQKDEYFGLPNPELDPAMAGAKQMNAADDFYGFWGEVLLHVLALELQYNKAEVARVSGSEAVANLDPFTVLDEFDAGLEFDVRELNPDFLEKKLKAVNEQVLPTDAAGVIDRTAYTKLQLRMMDPRLAQQIIQDPGPASQKIYDDVELNVMRMAQGNEARYVENDPTAKMKLQFLKTIVSSNPKYMQWLGQTSSGRNAGAPSAGGQAMPGQGAAAASGGGDPRFRALMENYAKNLMMSVQQEENKQVGRIGVKPLRGGNV